MDVLVLKQHGLKIVRASPYVLLLSFVVVFFVGYFWFLSLSVLVAGIILGVVLFYCNFRYWVSGNSAYWLVGVFGGGVLPAITLKSFHGVALILGVEALVISALVLINRKRLIHALS